MISPSWRASETLKYENGGEKHHSATAWQLLTGDPSSPCMAIPYFTEKRLVGGISGPDHWETQTQWDRTRSHSCRDLYNVAAGSLHRSVEMHGVSTQKGEKETDLKGNQCNSVTSQVSGFSRSRLFFYYKQASLTNGCFRRGSLKTLWWPALFCWTIKGFF